MSCSETPLHQHLLFSCSAANQWLSNLTFPHDCLLVQMLDCKGQPNRKPHVKDLHYFKKTKLGFNTTAPLRHPSLASTKYKKLKKIHIEFRKLQFCILTGFHLFSYSVCMFKFRILYKADVYI